MKKSFHVLADLASTRTLIGFHPLNPVTVGTRLDDLIYRLSKSLIINSVSNEELRFRFYDGWRDELGGTTQLRDLVNLYLKESYSTRRKIEGKLIRIFASLAEAPVFLPNAIFPGTIRTIRGLPPHQIVLLDSNSYTCIQKGCTLSSTLDWLRKGKCPKQDCKLALSDFIGHKLQKLVDCHIASDLISLAHYGEDISLVSMDTDFIPPLISASALNVKVYWICTENNSLFEGYKSILCDSNVEVIEC